MDPQLLFRPMATVEADLAARRASQSAPTDPLNPSAPSAAAPSSGVLSSNITGSAEPGLPAVGSSGLGLASGAAPPAGAAGLAGGLGSSPNVPAPGTSINPATGLPHTAGLTRQELAAMKAEQEHGRRMSEMSGRQQAAAQLVGSGPVLGGAGQPGSPTGGEKSVIDDVTRRMSTLGHKTYDALPPAIKDVFAEPKGKGPEGSPVKPRRGSAAAMFENVKNTASRLSHDLQQTVSNAIAEPEGYHPSQPGIGAGVRRPSAAVATSPSARRESLKSTTSDKTAASEPSVFQQVKGFLSEAFEAPPAGGYPAPTAAGATANRTLPSEENQGARPGEVSAGAGALPGKATEAGVAVPPDVRAQEGTDGGHITTSSAPSTAATTGAPSSVFGSGTTIVPAPVSAVDAGAFGAAFLPPAGQVQRGGPAHSNVPITEKSKVEEVVENLADKAKGFFGFGTAWDEKEGEKDKAKLNELRRQSASNSDPIADGAVGAAFGRGTMGNTTIGQGASTSSGAPLSATGAAGTGTGTGQTATTGLSDLAPPIPATQTGVIDDKGTHLTPSTAPAGVKPEHSSSSGLGSGGAAAAAAAGAGIGGLAALAGANALNKSNDAGASANASGRSTPVPRAGALGAGTSDSVMTPSEAAVAAQSESYMDPKPSTGAGAGAETTSTAAPTSSSGLGAAGTGAAGGALAGGAAGAALADRHVGSDAHVDGNNKDLAVGSSDKDVSRPFASVPPNERLDSLASVTAIRHGQPGDLHNGADRSAPSSGAAGIGSSPLATVDSTDAVDRTHRPDDALASAAAASAGAAGALGAGAAAGATHDGHEQGLGLGQKSTTRGTGPNHTTSLTPGGEEGSIGHPPTVQGAAGEASRVPGTYPAAQHENAVSAAIKEAREEGRDIGGKDRAAASSGPGAEHQADGIAADKDKDKGNTAAANGASAAGTGAAGAASAATPDKAGRSSTSADRSSAGAVPASPASTTGHGNGNGGSSGHRRASSSASTDSKKVGFMKKLKGEMKVISGKLGNNEEKVQLGEKIKHGEA